MKSVRKRGIIIEKIGEGSQTSFVNPRVQIGWTFLFLFIYSKYFNDILHGLKGKAETGTK